MDMMSFGPTGDRFVLHFSEVTGIDETQNNIIVYASNKTINVLLSDGMKTGTINVFDMTCRVVLRQNITSYRTIINLNTVGIYVVEVQTEKNIISRKVSIQ